jgi:hypothetical protein
MPEQNSRKTRLHSSRQRLALRRRHPPRAADIDTTVQEELSGEVVALSSAVVAMLRERGYLEDPDLTEDVALEAAELILFAAMNCAHRVIDSVGRARSDRAQGRRFAVANCGRRAA